MPWLPEFFSEPVLERVEEQSRQRAMVPYYMGLMSGDLGALVESFGGEPELHDPVRGRIRGRAPFEAFVGELTSWLRGQSASFEEVGRAIAGGARLEEVVVHLDGVAGRVDVPVAIVAEHGSDRRLRELRVYHSTWPLAGRHAHRPPLLQPDGRVRLSGVVADYQEALAAGDAEQAVASFEPDGYAREPAGAPHVYHGGTELRAFYELLFSNGGGIGLEHCAATDDGHVCALEYNVVRWGASRLPPQAGVAVYERGASGALAAARIYDDVDPPLRAETYTR